MRTRRTAQAGVVAVLLLVILVMGSLYALLSGVNTATAELQQKRDDVTTVALKQAKEALIAYAATRPARPGALPCPDLNNNGIAGGAGFYGNNNEAIPGGIHGGFTCPDTGRQIGRLPWVTLGLPDLRDASAERLWYVISPNFRNDGSQVVNSDTLGLLAVAGVTPAAGVVAIIFAPGQTLAGAGQNRSGAGVNDVVQYLEGANSDLDAGGNFVAAQRCEQAAPACPLGPFNDQFVTVTHQELFDAVENVVARRLETEIVPRIQEYVAAWGIHPFAAPYDDLTPVPPVGPPTTPDRPQSMYFGRDGHINGLLPVAYYDALWTKDLANGWVGWQAGAFGAAKVGFGLGDIVTPITPASCNWVIVVDNGPPGPPPDPSDDVRWRCSFTYDGGAMSATVGGTLNNVARSLALPFNSAAAFAVTVSDLSGPLATPPVLGLSNALQTTGHADVFFNLNLPAPPAGPATVTITFPAPRFSPAVDPADATLGWFAANQWYRLAYYSVTDGCRLNGPGACAPGITVQGAGGPPTAARSVLVLAGRNLAGGARPWAIASYFEVENATSPLFNEADPSPPSFSVFARGLRSLTFNDKIAVVTP
ncbi:MAG TPA: hypothetical protein VJM14_02920 [Burkholderiales bacterium]|nr:hypothetical protein [Burkholderiales bacterium]